MDNSGGREKALEELLRCPECKLLPHKSYLGVTVDFNLTPAWLALRQCSRNHYCITRGFYFHWIPNE